MGVRAAVIDLDGTLLNPDGTAAPGVTTMLEELRAMGMSLVVASGRPGLSERYITQRLATAGLRVDLVLARDAIGENKGAKVWVATACSELSVAANELVWLGDSDGDIRSAVNTHVVYFNAGWSNPGYPYGIQIGHPSMFSLLVGECFAKGMYWYWQLSGTDGSGRAVTARALIDGGGANIPALKHDLLAFLKYKGEPTVGPFKVRDFIMLHLLGSTLSVREIGEEMHVSPNTIKSHTQAIYRKLGVSARSGAIEAARLLGL